jgi:DNA-binding SARP family transcriptional activator
MLRVRLLGELSLELDGRPVPAPASRPTRSLLAWLALHPGMHARSRLAGRLWPDVRDDSARTSLRKAVADLRRALGPDAADALVATREGVGLAPAPMVSVDILEFDQLLSATRLEEAVELSRGELLPELDDDWVYDARDDHRARLAAAVARLGDVAEQQGDLERAVQRAREHIVLEPLAEQAHRTLIRRLVAAGDRAAALAAYARLRDRLRQLLS